MQAYAKFIVALLGAFVGAVHLAMNGDGAITGDEWITVIIAVFTAISVYGVENKDETTPRV